MRNKTTAGTIDKPGLDLEDKKDGFDRTEDTLRTNYIGNNHPQDVK